MRVRDALQRDALVDEPSLVGARWWQDSVVDPVGRRRVIETLLAAGVGLGLVAATVDQCEVTTQSRAGALDLQRKYGWSFGAAAEGLVYNGQTTEPFDPDRLARMLADFAPRSPAHRPFYVQTLFEAPTAVQAARAEGDPAPIAPLATSLRPISTTAMNDAFERAQAAAGALAALPGVALVVDLDGPESVAFAAGACELSNTTASPATYSTVTWPPARSTASSGASRPS